MKKNNINWFHSIEEKIWGDAMVSNPYFATVCIYVAAIAGALLGGGNAFSEMFDWNLRVSLLGTLGFLWTLWTLNVAESVFSCAKPLPIVWRSLLIFLFIVLAFILGVAASLIIIGIITIVFIIWLLITLITAFSMMLGGDRVKLTDGWGRTVTKGTTGLGGDVVYGDDGKEYERGSDGSFREK